MDRIREQAHRDGYVETLFGRRLYLTSIHSRNQATPPRIFHEGARMIAEDFAASARRAEPQWWFHWGDKQRGDCRKRPARAAPVQNGRGQFVIASIPVEIAGVARLDDAILHDLVKYPG
jgi:hypothetical protein